MKAIQQHLDELEKISSLLGMSVMHSCGPEPLAIKALELELGSMAAHASLCAIRLTDFRNKDENRQGD